MLLCITLIGIPLGLANFKLIPVSLLPFGREIVSIDEARGMGLEPAIVVGERVRRLEQPPPGPGAPGAG